MKAMMSVVPLIASGTGAGTTDEQKIIRNTAIVLELDQEDIKISNAQKDNNIFTGSDIFYDAQIVGKKTGKFSKILRCNMVSSWVADSKPNCVAKGSPTTSCDDLL